MTQRLAKDIPLKEKYNVVIDFLSGTPKKEISKRYNIDPRSLSVILNNDNQTNTDLEKRMFSLYLLRENHRIIEIKERIMCFFEQATEEALIKDGKPFFVDKFKGIFEVLDKAQRLNENRPTDLSQNNSTLINADIAKIMAELKTPEDKKAFLTGSYRPPVIIAADG